MTTSGSVPAQSSNNDPAWIRYVAGGLSPTAGQLVLQPFDVAKTRMIQLKDPSVGMTQLFSKIVAEEGPSGLWRGGVPTVMRVSVGGALFYGFQSSMMGFMEARNGGKMPDVSQTAAAGFVSRGAAAFIAFPLSVVKTRIESSAHREYKGVFDALATVARKEGLGGLYAGMWPTLTRDSFYSGASIVTYTRCKTWIADATGQSPKSFQVQFLTGFITGGGLTVLTHPAEVLRTRLQLIKNSLAFTELPGSRRIINEIGAIWTERGWKGFYRGVTPRVMKKSIFEQAVQKLGGKTHL